MIHPYPSRMNGLKEYSDFFPIMEGEGFPLVPSWSTWLVGVVWWKFRSGAKGGRVALQPDELDDLASWLHARHRRRRGTKSGQSAHESVCTLEKLGTQARSRSE